MKRTMSKKQRHPDPEPHPEVAAGGLRRTRYYIYMFFDTLRDTGHEGSHVKQVMLELLGGMTETETAEPRSGSRK